jgi:hypothetical protein
MATRKKTRKSAHVTPPAPSPVEPTPTMTERLRVLYRHRLSMVNLHQPDPGQTLPVHTGISVGDTVVIDPRLFVGIPWEVWCQVKLEQANAVALPPMSPTAKYLDAIPLRMNIDIYPEGRLDSTGQVRPDTVWFYPLIR